MLRNGFLFLCALLLVGCAQSAIKDTPAASAAGHPFTLLLSSARFLELDSCGCSVVDWGGVEREWNATRVDRATDLSSRISLTSGPVFFPFTGVYDEKLQTNYREISEGEVDALGRLQTEAISISVEDLLLGVDHLRGLENRAKFKFTSANLYDPATDKPLFPRFVVLPKRDFNVVVIGLTHVGNAPVAKKAAAVVKDPIQALREVMKEIPTGPRLVVLLSTLDPKEQDQIADIAGVNVVVGSAGNSELMTGLQTRTDQLTFEPPNRGRSIARLTLDIPTLEGKPFHFYNAQVKAGMFTQHSALVARQDAFSKNPKRKNDPKLKEIDRDIARHRAVLQAKTTGPYTDYEFQIVPLDASHAGANELSEIATKYRALRPQTEFH